MSSDFIKTPRPPKFFEEKFGRPRVRMAPSPTGKLHIGTARTALFNYLFAKHEDGKFILRIEDTDLERSDPKFEKDILENLKWLGIEWDEFYRQSERIPIYAKYLDKLIKEGKAYHCFCSEEDLEARRQEQISRGLAPRYNGKCREFSESEVKKKLAEGKPSIIRFILPAKKVVFSDIVRGELEFDSSLIGDFAIAKDLATPLYNFAVVVDDFEMKITHIIRGEDHISNTPKQILLQETLGFPQPKYAHLPLTLGPDRSKLSKRHEVVAVQEYKKQGYLPEALVNFMVFLGWNPGTEKEIFSMEDLIKEFSLERVQKAGAIFNIRRLDYLNGFYIRQKPIKELAKSCQPYLSASRARLAEAPAKRARLAEASAKRARLAEASAKRAGGPKPDLEYIEKIVGIYQERIKKLSEITELTDFFFKDVLKYNKELLRWKDMSNEEVLVSLNKLEKILCDVKSDEWKKENLERILMSEAEKMGLKPEFGAKGRGYLLWPFRVALTGKEASAGPFEIAEILGKEKTLKRIKEAREL